MDSKEYVLNHDFGYGREPELDELFKLELRNLEDVKLYVFDAIKNAYIEPEKIRKCRNEFSVVFKNGDYWQALRFSENQRGRRANVLILDRNLNMNEIDLAKMALIEKPYGSVTYYYYEGKTNKSIAL